MSAALLRADGVSRVILVAHGFDMPRATAEFADAGIVTIPAPTGIPAEQRELVLLDFVPNAAALQTSYYALYELFAGMQPPSRRRIGTARRGCGTATHREVRSPPSVERTAVNRCRGC